MLFPGIVETVRISKAMHEYAMFPKCGTIDNIVKINDKVQIFDDLSAIIFPNVGKILLEKNSLTYIPIKILFFLIVIQLLNLFSMKLTQIAWPPRVSAA